MGLTVAVVLTMMGLSPASTAETIKIGEINSYSSLPAFTLPYRNGWQLALEQINAAGGIQGRSLEVISRDDSGKPGDAVTAANELVNRDGAELLFGTYFSNVGLAVSDFANQKKIFFLGAEPLTDAITWEKGNRYTFRLRPGTYMQAAMLVEEAAKLPAKRWATVAPNYEYGQAAVKAFKQLMSAKRPDIEWVGEQWPVQGKIDAGATVQALARAEPDAIFNVTFGADLAKFIREGSTRGLFANRAVVSLLTGEPEYLDPLGDETPKGWIVTGYPWYDVRSPEHDAFLAAYRAKYNEAPRLGAMVGYIALKSIAEILRRADSTDSERLVGAAEGLHVATPLGDIVFRREDHQSTMGAFVGKTDVRDGKGVMVDWHYASGADYLPSADEVKKLRPQE
jgi:branched-chain amino acid transport system substrate-binding protein